MKQRLTYVYIAFALSFVIIAAVSNTLFKKINSIKNSSDWVEHTLKVKSQILVVQMKLVEAESSQRGYLLTRKASMLVPLTTSQKEIFKELNTLDSLTRDNKRQQLILKDLKEIVSHRYQFLYSTIEIDPDKRREDFQKSIDGGQNTMQKFISLANNMDDEESRLSKRRRESQEIFQNSAPKYLLLVLVISGFFQVASFVIIIKALNKQREYQVILENKIKDLNNTNAEIEQIAFVASHDLQEPLRKIRTFSDRLINLHAADLKEEGKKMLEKMAISSRRMQELLNDLINYTRLASNEEEQRQVSLEECLKSACTDLKTVIDAKKATIHVSSLPVINGYYKQLYLLFFNLIDNSLKFSKPDIAPVITIDTASAQNNEIDYSNNFLKITIQDNGIGFKKEFASKIFIIFQRLHSQSSLLPGKGIGLAICKRIMINHKGNISATGELGNGAKFNLYFPKN